MAEMTLREAIRQALREEMQRDERVFLMGEDIGAYGGAYAVTKGLVDEFGPLRVRDTPISEGTIVGVAVGAAMGGMRPVAELMTINFALLAMDAIVNSAAKVHYMFGGQITDPVVIRTASGWGQLAATHSQSFESWFAHVPGLIVVMPATPYDAKGLLKAAIRDDNPVVFIEHSLVYGIRGEVPEGDYVLPFGKADVKREGSDVTIVTYARMLHISLRAAVTLASQGIEAEIIDLRSLRPLDIETVLKSVRKTNHVVIAEEDWKTYGVGAEVAARIVESGFDSLDAPPVRVAMQEVPMPYARNLERAAIPDETSVINAVKSVV
ncbi:MAG: pyruvate dehydrogenase complex E1 component subunit beta [Chloroflexota bacterium]|nr:MAG: pyruvate dehydrogenase complex E1 component subunit beta [Chloroflexota bacterium]